MKIKSGIHKKYDRCFFLTETIFRKIVEIIREHLSKKYPKAEILFIVYRQNSSYYETQNLEDVLSEDNTNVTKIKRIVIKVVVEASTDKSLIYIDFDAQDEIGIYFQILNDDRSWAILLHDDVDQQIQRTIKSKKWLMFLERKTIPIVFITIFTFFIFLATSKHNSVDPSKYTQLNINNKLDSIYSEIISTNSKLQSAYYLFFFPILVMILYEFGFIRRASDWLHESVFYWGDEVERFDRKLDLKKNIFWVVIVGIILIIVGAFVTKYLSNII